MAAHITDPLPQRLREPTHWRALSTLRSEDMLKRCTVICDLSYVRASLPAFQSMYCPDESSRQRGFRVEAGSLSYRRTGTLERVCLPFDADSAHKISGGMRGIELHITKLALPRALDYFKLAALSEGRGLLQPEWLPLFAFNCEQKDEAHE